MAAEAFAVMREGMKGKVGIGKLALMMERVHYDATVLRSHRDEVFPSVRGLSPRREFRAPFSPSRKIVAYGNSEDFRPPPSGRFRLTESDKGAFR
jgi:hypothetical protein